MRHAIPILLLLGSLATRCAAAPSDAQLTRLMVGAWRSPRHDYRYFADGTWWMGRAEAGVTHGRWRVTDHCLIKSATYVGGPIASPQEESYPIERLSRKEIVFGGIYRMKRIRPAEIDR